MNGRRKERERISRRKDFGAQQSNRLGMQSRRLRKVPSENAMSKPSRWTAEERYDMLMEVLRCEEFLTQIAPQYQISDCGYSPAARTIFQG